MWVITGPFDTDIGADLSFQKPKLLKTGKNYALGRKSQPLIIGSKKVSQEHCLFNVGEYVLDDVHVPERRPKLEFVSKRDKSMRLMRGDEQLVVNPHSVMELRDGDVVHIVTGLPISVKWMQICCYSPNIRGKSAVSLETCAQLGTTVAHLGHLIVPYTLVSTGISVVYAPSALVTHHLISTYVANASIAASLISAAQFVKFEWLQEILKSADALEEKFVLPAISKHRPTFSPSLSPSQKVFKVWEPNEERINMFAAYRFLVLGEKTRDMDSDLRTLIKRGEGIIDTFDIAGGVTKLHKALTRGQAKENQQLVVVADVKDVKACIGEDEWKKLVAEVQSFELHITYPETIVQSVLDVEPALIAAQQPSPFNSDALDNSSLRSLPTMVPNSVPDEPSIPPEELPKKRLSRRATSRQPSVEPTSQPDVEEVKIESPKHRRILLSRRGRTAELEEKVPDGATAPPAAPSSRLRLKRRLGGAPASEVSNAGAQSQLPDFAMSGENEPPLKKFKALFDASDPTRPGAGSFDEEAIMGTGVAVASQTQSLTQGFVRRPAAGSSLNALREEEEESVGTTQNKARGVKRTLDMVHEEDGDIEMVGSGAEGGEPPRKKQAVNNSELVRHETTTTEPANPNGKDKERNPGAPVGRPDTDAEFLKAVASTKKGKRTEDAFDREFNNLRISKPKPENVERKQREEEEEWRKFTDFGDDAGLRGNFMVVMEMSVYRNDEQGDIGLARTGRGARDKELPEEWRDKPNFKKFKKKLPVVRGALVELVVNDDLDLDARPRRRRQQLHATSSSRIIESESQSMPLRTASDDAIVIDSSDEDHKPIKALPPSRSGSRAASRAITSNPSSRAGSVVPTKRTASTSHKPALFLISEDEMDEPGGEPKSRNSPKGDEDEYGDDDQTLRSNTTVKAPSSSLERPRTTTTGRRTTRRTAADDSDDDGAVFKGFGGGRRKR